MGVVALAALASPALAACSGDDGDGAAATSTTASSTTASSTTVPTTTSPSGPTAVVSERLTGGSGPFIGAASGPDLGSAGYVEEEFVAAGTATSYRPEGELDADGTWTFAEDTAAPYRTRVLVRRPSDPDDASGTVVVEWLNVSGGIDANPDWSSLEEEIVRRGHTWIGVSAQLIGVEGGPVLVSAPGAEGLSGRGLVGIDPARYGTLDHPGDGFSFDIFTQVARAARAGGDVTGGVVPDVVLAAGESQSALALTTYYNGVQPLSGAFDGFFVHSRAAVPLPLVGPGEYADLTGAITGLTPTTFRTDLDAPVLGLQAEGDVVGVLDSQAARQDDSPTFRLWEVAGTAHADRHLLGPIADQVDCGAPVNDGPLHVVAKAGLRALEDWVRDGNEPPTADRLELTATTPPAIARDTDGIAVGGVRTPPVDVPAVVLSGDPPPNDDLLCLLLGSTTALPAERLAERYPSAKAYEAAYATAAEATTAAGFALTEDRAALAAYARPDLVGG